MLEQTKVSLAFIPIPLSLFPIHSQNQHLPDPTAYPLFRFFKTRSMCVDYFCVVLLKPEVTSYERAALLLYGNFVCLQ
jgi:hypothetical protein